MIDHGKKNLIGVQIDAVDYEAAVERVIQGAKEKRGMACTALAVHGVMTGVSDSEHRYRLNHFDMIVPDGQPVRWGVNLLHGTKLPDRVYGPTLTLKICERAAEEGLPVYFYGSRQEVIDKLIANLKDMYPKIQIAGTSPSRFRRLNADEKEEVAETIKSSGAAITFVGLGCPRQEVWAYEYRDALSMPLIAVGAAFDFHAGTLPQAPRQMQNMGLEWLFRLIQEPKRLWRRYLILNPTYLYLLANQALRIRKFDLTRDIMPAEEIRYG